MLEYKNIEANSNSLDELLETLDYNASIASKMRDEIKRLKEVEAVNIDKNTSLTIYPPEQVPEKGKDTTFEKEVEYYRKKLQNLSTDIQDLFPRKDNPNFERILLRLKLETKKNMQEINDIIATEIDTISKNLLDYCKEELEKESQKLQLINQQLEQEKEIETPEISQENRLIFVPTATGKILALEEVKN